MIGLLQTFEDGAAYDKRPELSVRELEALRSIFGSGQRRRVEGHVLKPLARLYAPCSILAVRLV